MKFPQDKFQRINNLINTNTGLEQFKGMLFSLSQNDIIDQKDRTKLNEYLAWISTAPIKVLEQDWEKEKPRIVINARPAKKRKEIEAQVLSIWQFVYDYILNKYSEEGHYRASGHFIDQKLNKGKVIRQKKQQQQLDLELTEAAQSVSSQVVDFKLHKHDFTSIQLSPPQEKLIRSVLMLLHLHSSLDLDNENYYAGNGDNLYAEEGNRLPHLKVRPIDLYKAYTGKNNSKNISGAEIRHIKKVLFELEKQHFQVTYRRVVKKQVKQQEVERVQLVTMNKPLFKVISFLEITKEEEQKMEAGDDSIRELREELILALNPIFIDQIKTKYVEFPMNITRRVESASGGAKKVTEAINLLIDYLLREKSSKRYECEIDFKNLALTLGLERLINRGEKTRARKKIDSAIHVAQSIGLLDKVMEEIGAKRQHKIIFHINPNFK